jgi:hypothetical protein
MTRILSTLRRRFWLALIDRHFYPIHGLFPSLSRGRIRLEHNDTASVMEWCHFGVTGLSSLLHRELVRSHGRSNVWCG